MNTVLFVPYFRPDDPARQAEIELCLEKNKANPALSGICLIVDEAGHEHLASDRVKVHRVQARPTYRDWVELSYLYAPDAISLLANADIYFLDDVSRLAGVFANDPTGFVALSRYDGHDAELVRHPNPHWSQDSWAFLPRDCRSQSRDAQLGFPLGVPRCDNKVAYVFAAYGHNVYNPCDHIRSVHVHESAIRSYSKKGDMRIVGGVAMVHPCETLTTPSSLDFELWPVRPELFQSVTVNRSLGKWTKELELSIPETQPLNELASPGKPKTHAEPRARLPKESGALFAEANLAGFDAHWQHPAITEQHAFNRLKALAPRESDVAYLGFPWATLIDVSNHNKQDEQRRTLLRSALDNCAGGLKAYRRIATVCQHIHLKQYSSLLSEAGVTDVFWSHAVTDEPEIAEHGLTIHPFPLYPVQACDDRSVSYEARRYLFSFVGAKATPIYLSEARTHIIEELAGHPMGLVRERPNWHYNRIVYDSQILGRAEAGPALVDEAASEEFRDVMRQSIFTLCPSGTGPNSIRLWEAICSDSIPVVMAETYRHPGSESLWREAVVECGEDRQSIAKLPERLAEIASDTRALLKRKAALRMLALRYGPNSFVADIVSMMRS